VPVDAVAKKELRHRAVWFVADHGTGLGARSLERIAERQARVRMRSASAGRDVMHFAAHSDGGVHELCRRARMLFGVADVEEHHAQGGRQIW